MTTSWATAARVVPGLDHDPCPGDVPAVHQLAADLRARADLLAAAVGTCRSWQPPGWRGAAADEALHGVGDLADGLVLLGRSVEEAAGVLVRWAGDLEQLQAEAGTLGARAQEMHRRHLQTTLLAVAPATPSDVVALQQRLLVESRALQREVDELQDRWLAASRRRSAELDEAAPPDGSASWRGSWDLAHDRYQDSTRRQARMLGWAATAGRSGSVVAGLAAVGCPPAAAVAAGLGVMSAMAEVRLAAGADGSAEDAGRSVVDVAAGAALGVLGGLAGRGGPVLRELAEGAGTASDGVSAAEEVAALAGLRGDGETTGTLPGLDGGTVELTVHDVASPWHVGHGLDGGGFVGVAVVPVPGAPAPSRPRPAPAGTRPAAAPRPAPGSRPDPPTTGRDPARAGSR